MENKGMMDILTAVFDKLQAILEQVTPPDLYTFNEHYGILTFYGVLWAFVFMLLMVGLAYLFYKKDKALRFCDRYLTYAFVAVWLLGFVVYDVGMYPDHSADWPNALLAILGVGPMAIIHAFGMFILQSDVSAIHDACHNSGWYMFFFSIAHLLAAFISMVFVIRHFGFNIVAAIIKFIKTYFWVSDKENLYVFWGMNDATYYLAKDIIADKNNAGRIMIIRVKNAKEDPNKLIGMDRLFNFLSVSNSHLDKLQELQKLGCLTSSTFGSMTDMPDDKDLISHELRMNSVVKLMKHTTGRVHMFLLGDDEEFNLQSVGNLKRDKTVSEYVQPKSESQPKPPKVTFYCHARKGSIHRVIEDEPTHENIEVRLIDSSYMSVELLKMEEKVHLQPVSYVDIKDDATVSSAFNALVVGFSEVGLDMVRFLYEFGAFVKYKDKKDETAPTEDGKKPLVERSPFHCYVVDKEMKSLAGTFAAKAEAIHPVLDPKDEDEALKSLISLHHMDCQSKEFYEHLKEWLPTINYVVFATGDDEFNMSQAVRLFKLAIRYRDNLEHFRIMVRVRHDESGHFERIAHHYNRLWAAECAETVDEKKEHQKTIKVTDEVDAPITPFGSSKEIYTASHIINEKLKAIAMKFKEKYDKSLYKHQEADGKIPYPIVTWDQQQNDAMQLTGEFKDYSPTYTAMTKLRRVQDQNYANSLHIMTKVILARTALKVDKDYCLQGLARLDNKMTYEWRGKDLLSLEKVRPVMDVLAQTEHLRWVASHEIRGYQRDPSDKTKRDEARLIHQYMCDWWELPEETRSFDYNAVDVSLIENGLLSNEDLTKTQNDNTQ